METLYIKAADDCDVPIYWTMPEQQPRVTLLLLPALGIQARLYRQLASALAAQGCATAIMEQRGHGLSKVKPGYGVRFGFDEFLYLDIPAVMEWIKQQVPTAPRLLGGHSLGGHLSTIYAGMQPHQVDGVIHLACAFPYLGDYADRQRRTLRLLCALIPLFGLLPGYYPGHLIGFGDRESARLMSQWRQWALSGDFDYEDKHDLAAAVAAFDGPVLSVSFERDDFSTPAAVARALSPFTGATVMRVELGEREQGTYLGHTGWAKQPDGAAAAIGAWLDTQFPRS
ncbi:alpha/beta fold hydrolase [Pseudohalioglobus sediminis]|uniref:Alpha/beta fold hydrolase n=1 Tax=Pseudohalioglobus sediminis TaxID=2606449 RepID=A0A5B0X278_9GAMM|nr:alpha/beta fold hydrolase [Pseudohalioglobus sediminis]KAA1193312.1 alpha/beta fold hydrolase [Pseudohalioglobus sediminis]